MNPPKLRRVARALLEEELHLQSYVLDVHLVGDATIQHLNEQFLRHAGPTDVIAFDYSQETLTLSQRPPGDSETAALRGEIFLGIDVAFRQAPRFRTTPADELVRYLVHGILHLRGHNDHRPADRRRMKREENRLLRALRQRFRLADLLPAPRSDFPRTKR